MVKRPVKQPPRRQAIDVRLERQALAAAKLKRELRREKSIAQMARQLERVVQASDRALRELAQFVQERDGDGPLLQLEQVTALLEKHGELRDGQTAFEAVQRLLIRAARFDEFAGDSAAADHAPVGGR